ncbi:MAG: DUF262 domain-containing protein [Opitutae bacterium]|nr:DUF262 domain-containing protein [Opitutae bacterium]
MAQQVGQLLLSPEQFCIPRYQRDFKWDDENATELIEDLGSEPLSGDDGLFLGAVILEKSEEGKLAIVDGQQRITTLVLLLIASRERAKKLGDANRCDAIQKKIGFTDEITGATSGPRLLGSQSIREVFSYMSEKEWKGDFPAKIGNKGTRLQARRVRPVYNLFAGKVGGMSAAELDKFVTAIYRAYVFRIEIQSDIQALGIFERTNARGADLEVSDLLKNYLFSVIEDPDEIEYAWEQITKNASGLLLKMLKYFYVSKKGHVVKSELYKKLRGYAKETSPRAFTDQLLAFSHYFRLVQSQDFDALKGYFTSLGCERIAGHDDRTKPIYSAIEALREFGITQHIPLTFAALDCFLKNKGQEESSGNAIKSLVRLFTALERYHFINNAIVERVGNEVEKLYADTCEEFSQSTDFGETSKKLVTELLKKKATESEFVANFPKKVNYQSSASLVAYVFDRINNAEAPIGAGIQLYDPDERVFRRTHSIEHWLPRKPRSGESYDQKTGESVDEVGNLLVIPQKTNGLLDNHSPAVKREMLEGELNTHIKHLKHVEDFLATYGPVAGHWNTEEIAKRSQELAVLSYKKIWALP